MKQTVAFQAHAKNVFFHILTQCNLSCRHCYINPEQHGRQTLDIKTICKWLDAFSAQGADSNVIFLGGEPTMHPDLDQAIRHAHSTGYKSITVDTNGYCFHDILDKTSPGEVDVFSFSLDGPTPEVNDPIRGKGSFKICTENLQKAVKKGFGISLIYTVSTGNLKFLDQMPELLAKWGVQRFFIQVIGLRGNAASNSSDLNQLTRSQWDSVVPVTAEKAALLGIETTYPKVFLEPGEKFECAGKVAENYFIFPNGRVYRCPLCEDYPIHSLMFEDDRLKPVSGLHEDRFFDLNIPEGCVMNKLIQPGNVEYGPDGDPLYQVACCLLKERVSPPDQS
ncbi:Radical SAM domain protein [Desulfatibacillum aliphaticivorans]|uniref:Radical SAM domain protein n=1 Tax=Desulfatibacillum aliphaticivorans TaxID=218208 RepID=B8FI81_DESAL|nr:Radical SAM domain protein [Desulfatibacillum aliphaticivorans]